VAPHTPHSLWLGIQIERVLGDRNALSSYGMLLRNNFPAAEETKLYLKSK
jgi:type IV pilus assembly protein PilF